MSLLTQASREVRAWAAQHGEPIAGPATGFTVDGLRASLHSIGQNASARGLAAAMTLWRLGKHQTQSPGSGAADGLTSVSFGGFVDLRDQAQQKLLRVLGYAAKVAGCGFPYPALGATQLAEFGGLVL